MTDLPVSCRRHAGRNVWTVRDNIKRREEDDKGGGDTPRWIADDIVETSWRRVTGVDINMPYPDLRERVRAAHAWVGNRASMLHNFVTVMRRGDLVVVPCSREKTFQVAQIAGDYYQHTPAGFDDLRRVRRVEWLATEDDRFPHDAVSPQTWDQITNRDCVFHLHPDQAREVLDLVGVASRAQRADRAQWKDEYERLGAIAAGRYTDSEGRVRQVKERVRDRALRSAILARSKGACEYCGHRPDDKSVTGEWLLEVDHTLAFKDQGQDTRANLLAVCHNCHALKTHGSRRDALELKFRARASELHAAVQDC